MSEAPNAAQVEYWNQTAGPTWVELQDQLDGMIGPMGQAAIAALGPTPGEAILDIGCGCGRTSLQLAAAVGGAGKVVGADISATMLAVARARPVPSTSARPDFREIDAQTGDLGGGMFDAVFSRFGVMFFADPVAAFTNIRSALKGHGRLAFVCWRPLADNLWVRVPLEAALPLLPPLPPADPTAPGPYALADPVRLRADPGRGWLSGGDHRRLRRRPGRRRSRRLCRPHLPGRAPGDGATRQNPQYKDKVEGAVRRALAPYVTPTGVMTPGAVWIVTARAS